jgi:L-ascorbate oxidase
MSSRNPGHGLSALVGLSAGCLLFAGAAQAATIQEPYTLAASNGVLNLLMVAHAQTVPTLNPLNPTGLVYDVCIRPSNGSETCPPPPANVIPYAGPILKLMQNDVLNIHLVNLLPPLTDSFHANNPTEEPTAAFLSQNPTNLHTHGLLVSPHYPTAAVPNYGDNIYVYTFNPGNGTPPVIAAQHADVRMRSTDYSITIPSNHPSGLFWIHSHIHGISLNQITSGLSGTITIGNVGDYVCHQDSCSSFFGTLPIRNMVIKDFQALADGARMDEQDSAMCLSPTTGGLVLPPLNGYCAGQDFSSSGGPNYRGGRWFVTINGQQFPTVPMISPGGEIWRFTNESGSATHNLSVYNPTTHQNMIFQILAVDGVTLAPNAASGNTGRFHVVACPGVAPPTSPSAPGPLCADQILMMPSSRVEIWVAYRDASGNLTTPPTGASAVLLDSGYNTGPAGDAWPAVNLAQVNFTPTGTAHPPLFLTTSGTPLSIANPLDFTQDANQDQTTASITPDQGVTLANCVPLAAGHRRRIYFSIATDFPDLFGLGYEEVDTTKPPSQYGIYPAVPNTFKSVTEFNAAMPTVCLTLGPDNKPVPETWELVNLSGENHNFHIHQTKFSIISAPPQSGTRPPTNVGGVPASVDNVPVVHANGTLDPGSPNYNPNTPGGCLSAAAWKSGACQSIPTVVTIPFYVAGDYVFHCHIAEHTDGGMMAPIRVRILGQN